MTAAVKNEYHQLTGRLCRDASLILLRGAGGDKDSLLYKLGSVQRDCATPLGSHVFLAKAEDGKTRRLGVRYCHKRSCPRCCAAIAGKMSFRIAEACRRWRGRSKKHSFLFITLTIPHDRMQYLGKNSERAKSHFAECDLLLEKTWRAFSQTYKASELQGLGWKSQLRRSEVTFGLNEETGTVSYHTHIHCLVATTKDHKLERKNAESYRDFSRRQAEEVNLPLSNLVFAAWQKSMAAVLKKEGQLFPSILRRQRQGRTVLFEPSIEEVTKTGKDKLGRPRKLTFSVVKGGATCEAPFGNDTKALERYLASEMTAAHTKAGKGAGSYSWLQAIYAFGAEADWVNLLYRHWVTATYCSSSLEWGRAQLGREKKWVSFETYLLRGKKPKKKAKAKPGEIIGAIPASQYVRLAHSGELGEVLDEKSKATGEELLTALGGTSKRGQKKLFVKEQRLRLVREVAGLLKKGKYHHGKVDKVVAGELRQLIVEATRLDEEHKQIIEKTPQLKRQEELDQTLWQQGVVGTKIEEKLSRWIVAQELRISKITDEKTAKRQRQMATEVTRLVLLGEYQSHKVRKHASPGLNNLIAEAYLIKKKSQAQKRRLAAAKPLDPTAAQMMKEIRRQLGRVRQLIEATAKLWLVREEGELLVRRELAQGERLEYLGSI